MAESRIILIILRLTLWVSGFIIYLYFLLWSLRQSEFIRNIPMDSSLESKRTYTLALLRPAASDGNWRFETISVRSLHFSQPIPKTGVKSIKQIWSNPLISSHRPNRDIFLQIPLWEKRLCMFHHGSCKFMSHFVSLKLSNKH